MISLILLNFIAVLFIQLTVSTMLSASSISKSIGSRKFISRKEMKYSKDKLAKHFYRMYKYLYLQTSSGARAEEMLKNLYRIVSDYHLRKSLLQMSVVISHSNDVGVGLDYLRKVFRGEDGLMLIGILENISISGLSNDAFLRLDHMLFQKYLAQLQRETKVIKKRYFLSVTCFVIAASSIIFIPLLDQMMRSANIIFN